jgi:hypothetical protein
MFVGIGVGIGRHRFAGNFADSYSERVLADGGVIEALTCVDNASTLLQTAQWLLIPSGYKAGVAYAALPNNGNGDLTWSRASSASRVNSSGVVETPRTNLALNSVLAGGGSAPTSYSRPSATGTSTPISGTSYTSYQQVAVSQRPYFQMNASLSSVSVGEVFFFSFYLESFSGSLLMQDLIASVDTAGQTRSYYQDDVLVTGTTSVTTGRIGLKIEITSLGNLNVRFGIGCAGNATGIIIVSRPQLERSSVATEFIPTTTSVATSFQGIVQNGTDANNISRLDYSFGSCPALLLEPQRTNQIYNSGLSRAVIGSPGTLPTNYSYGTSSGLSKSIVNIGVENGLNFIDIRFQGTASRIIDILSTSNFAPASSGQTWSHSIYTKLISGSVNNLALAQIEFTSAGAYVAEGSQLINPTSTLTRYSLTRTLNGGASTTRVTTSLYFLVTVGQTYDYVVRIAQMQMELGSYITTPIVTPINASVTRLADSFTLSNIYTKGFIGPSGGTWYIELKNNIEYIRDLIGSGIGLGDTTTFSTGNCFTIRNGNITPSELEIFKRVNNNINFVYQSLPVNAKIAIKWNGSTADVFVNGTKVVNATPFTGINMENLGAPSIHQPMFIQQMALFNTPLSDASCQLLTT